MVAATAPDRIAASVLNDIGPQVNPAGISQIASYVGQVRPVDSWAEAAEAVRATNGTAFPERLDDEQFWLAFARRGVNLSKLESRPIPSRPFEYQFYLDIDGHAASEAVTETLREIQSQELTHELRILGTYPKAAARDRAASAGDEPAK